MSFPSHECVYADVRGPCPVTGCRRDSSMYHAMGYGTMLYLQAIMTFEPVRAPGGGAGLWHGRGSNSRGGVGVASNCGGHVAEKGVWGEEGGSVEWGWLLWGFYQRWQTKCAV